MDPNPDHEFFIHDNPKCLIKTGLRPVSDNGTCPFCHQSLIFLEGVTIKGPKTLKQLKAAFRRLQKRYTP